MLRKFSLMVALGLFSAAFVGCEKEEPLPDTVTPAVTPEADTEGAGELEEEEDLGSDEAMDDSNATTGN